MDESYYPDVVHVAGTVLAQSQSPFRKLVVPETVVDKLLVP